MAKISTKQWQKKLLGGDLLPQLNADVGLLGLRLFVGLAMAIAHGAKKIPPAERFVEGVAAMGFPLPEVFAWAAGLSEFAGGLLIAAGLLVRPASAFLLFTMAVAGFRLKVRSTNLKRRAPRR